jgi:hypothetical protein
VIAEWLSETGITTSSVILRLKQRLSASAAFEPQLYKGHHGVQPTTTRVLGFLFLPFQIVVRITVCHSENPNECVLKVVTSNAICPDEDVIRDAD